MSIGRSHNLPNPLAVLTENHDWSSTLIGGDVILVPVDLSVDQVTSVVVYQRHQFTIPWTVNLTDFVRPFLIVVEELGNVPVIVLPSCQTIQMIVVVSDVEPSTFSGAYQKSFGIVVEPLLSGILHHQTSVVVLVQPLAEFDNPVHAVVLHRYGVPSIGQRQHVPIRVVLESPWFLGFDSGQLSVTVPGVVLHVGVSVDSNVARIRSGLIDATASVVREFHPEDLQLMNRQSYLRLQESVVHDPREQRSSIEHGGLVRLRSGYLELPNLLQHACPRTVGHGVSWKSLAADSTLHVDQSEVRVVVERELCVAETSLCAKVYAFLDQQASTVLIVPFVFHVSFRVYHFRRQAALRVPDFAFAIAVDNLGKLSRRVIPVDDTSSVTGEHSLQQVTIVAVMLQVGSAAAWRSIGYSEKA